MSEPTDNENLSALRKSIHDMRDDMHVAELKKTVERMNTDRKLDQLSADVATVKDDVEKLNARFEGDDTQSQPGWKVRLDRVEQAQARSRTISVWIWGVAGSVIVAIIIAVLSLLRHLP